MTDLKPQPSAAQIDAEALATSDLEAVLGTPQGRRLLLMVLDRCGLHRTAFTGEAPSTDFRLGEQNVALWLVSRIEKVGPTEYPQLLLDAARLRDRKEGTTHVLDEE